MQIFSHNDCELILAHDIPGRLRVRSSILRTPGLQEEILEAVLSKIADIVYMRFNRRLGSLVIKYEYAARARKLILLRLCDLPEEVFAGPVERENPPDVLGLFISAGLTLLGGILPPTLKPVYTWVRNLPFLIRGADTLITEGLRVEVLDAVTLSVLTLQRRYFTTAATRLMLDVGEYLEKSVRYRSTKLLKTLLQPSAETVWIEQEGIEREIPFSELHLGDMVVVGSGELIAVDGVVVSGQATVNQASVTGESVPVAPAIGDTVYAGSVVIEGRLKIEVQTVGSEVSTARISSFIKESLVTKSEAQHNAEKLADNLVPVSFATGAAVFLLTRNLSRTAAVFAVDYSCAMKLICPTAQKAAMYAIAQHGVLVRGATALEGLGKIDALVFDKTGTVTTGMFSISDIIGFCDYTPESVLSIAAAAEEHYTHPIARAVVVAARERKINIPHTSEVDFVVAHGVSAYVDERLIRVGSRHFINDDELVDCSVADEQADRLRLAGNTILYVASDDKLIGIIALSDTLREESELCLRFFRELGVERMIMLTGDNEITAKAIATKLGVEVRWELKPQDKAEVVASLQDEGYSVAFIGDGVNDAPALVAADVGVSMAAGSDIAREAAQIVLLRDELLSLVYAYGLARNSQEKISTGMKTSIGINTVTLLLSTLGKVSPLTAALIHNGSTVGSLIYVLNGARVSRKTEKLIKHLSGDGEEYESE